MLTGLVSFALLVDRLAVIATPAAHAPHHGMSAHAWAWVEVWRVEPCYSCSLGFVPYPFSPASFWPVLSYTARLAVIEHIDGFLTCRAPHDVTHGSSSIGALDLEAGEVADLSSASMMTEA